MFLYSDTSMAFLRRLHVLAQEILVQEMGLKFHRSRFRYKQWYVPLKLVVFEKPGRLGFCDPRFYQIGINRTLMYTAKTALVKNILRHELAHLFCHLELGSDHASHGPEFRRICESFSWGEEVWAATCDVSQENDSMEGDLHSEAIIERVKKLLSLAQSENVHEAELATLKANKLLLKHNLQSLDQTSGAYVPEELYVERVLEASRSSAKMQAISEILRFFLVEPVFNHGKNIVYLEVTGTRTNVEIAHYVASFLDKELDHLWVKVKKENPHYKGLAYKNSFVRGVAEGYREKQIELNAQMEIVEKNALMVINKGLKKQLRAIYRGLSSSGGRSTTHLDPLMAGKEAGRNLSIHRSLNSGNKVKGLSFF